MQKKGLVNGWTVRSEIFHSVNWTGIDIKVFGKKHQPTLLSPRRFGYQRINTSAFFLTMTLQWPRIHKLFFQDLIFHFLIALNRLIIGKYYEIFKNIYIYMWQNQLHLIEFLAYEVVSWLSICKYHFDALCIGLNFKTCLKTWHWYIPSTNTAEFSARRILK